MYRVLLVDNTYYPSNPFFLAPLQDSELVGEVSFVDERIHVSVSHSRTLNRLSSWLSIRQLPGTKSFSRALVSAASEFRPDLVLIVKGTFVKRSALEEIRSVTSATIVNYATDDPLNRRASPRNVAESIPLYDLYVSTKSAILDDLLGAGARRVAYVPFGFNQAVHFREPPAAEQRSSYECDLSFIGTMDEDRAVHVETLMRAIPGLRVKVWGSNWDRHPELRAHWSGMADAREFRQVVGASKVNLNLVRKANRDGHVMRSFEVPACAGFMVAERTGEHQEIFREGEHVALFSGRDELVDVVRHYLEADDDRRRIAEAGHRHVVSGRNSYHDRLTTMLELVGASA